MTNLYDSYWQSRRNCSDPIADTTSNQTLSQLALNWTISVETSKLTQSLFFDLSTKQSGLSIQSSALKLKQLPPQVDSFSVRGTLHLSRSHKALVCYEENLKFNFENLFTQDESLIQFRNFVRMLAHFCFYSTLSRVSSYSSTIYIIPVVLLTVAWNITR